MSDILYPISLIDHLVSTPFAPVIGDEFRDGTTSTRRLWAAQYFKRQLQITHSPMTRAEFQYLRSFYSQRSGMYDSFWFRDNIHLDGNIKVRFAQPVPRQFQGSAYMLQVDLDEVAPVRALIEWDEVLAAAGSAPSFLWDPCREVYYSHTGTIYSASQVNDFYGATPANPAVLQSGALFTDIFAGTLEQSQYFRCNGSAWAKTAANISGLAGTQPAGTVFGFFRTSSSAVNQCLVGIGAAGSATSLGIGINGSNHYTVWEGSSSDNVDSTFVNSPVNTWRSLAVAFQSGSNNALFYANGALISTTTHARSYAAGPASLFAGSSGGNLAGGGTTGDAAAVLFFAGAQLNVTQIKALHNLFAPLYGVALVS